MAEAGIPREIFLIGNSCSKAVAASAALPISALSMVNWTPRSARGIVEVGDASISAYITGLLTRILMVAPGQNELGFRWYQLDTDVVDGSYVESSVTLCQVRRVLCGPSGRQMYPVARE